MGQGPLTVERQREVAAEDTVVTESVRENFAPTYVGSIVNKAPRRERDVETRKPSAPCHLL